MNFVVCAIFALVVTANANEVKKPGKRGNPAAEHLIGIVGVKNAMSEISVSGPEPVEERYKTSLIGAPDVTRTKVAVPGKSYTVHSSANSYVAPALANSYVAPALAPSYAAPALAPTYEVPSFASAYAVPGFAPPYAPSGLGNSYAIAPLTNLYAPAPYFSNGYAGQIPSYGLQYGYGRR